MLSERSRKERGLTERDIADFMKYQKAKEEHGEDQYNN
jgi:hypothetical protein